MKKVAICAFLLVSIGFAASAQTAPAEAKEKTKKTSTVSQKVHNVIHPHHKHYSGVKTKGKVSQ